MWSGEKNINSYIILYHLKAFVTISYILDVEKVLYYLHFLSTKTRYD